MTPATLEKSVKKLPDEQNVLRITDKDAIAYRAVNCFILEMKVLEVPESIPGIEDTPTNVDLRELAKKKKPPQEWLEGEEEQLF